MNEKAQIRALSRTQPVLPMRAGQIERHTHDYKRHGTTGLFAALDVATGQVLGKCYHRHRSVELFDFLKRIDAAVPADLDIHIVLDDYGTHKTALVRSWLQKRSRYHLHFTSTHASWLNQIERWFALLTQRQSPLPFRGRDAHDKITVSGLAHVVGHTSEFIRPNSNNSPSCQRLLHVRLKAIYPCKQGNFSTDWYDSRKFDCPRPVGIYTL